MSENPSFASADVFPVQTYRRPRDLHSLRLECVSFSGTPRKHPFDAERVILLVDPYSTNTVYYEFEKKDIAYVEELPSLVDMDGATIPMFRLWVRKGSIGLRSTPFIVGDTRPPG